MRLGTRASALARAQAARVAELLGDCEIVPVAGRAERAANDKSRWVRDLERALLEGEIDLAVHSAKDVPADLPAGLALLGAPARAAPEDVICGARSLDELGPGDRVGTSSLRRTAQLLAVREDLDVVELRGNVDTRLRRLERGELAAIVLARAGLERLGRADAAGAVLDAKRFVPAPGQGTLALEGRDADADARAAVEAITDADALAALRAERALARALGADCDTPLGAHAEPCDGGLRLRAWIGLPDGSQWAGDELTGDRAEPEALGRAVAGRLELIGAGELLEEARSMLERERPLERELERERERGDGNEAAAGVRGRRGARP